VEITSEAFAGRSPFRGTLVKVGSPKNALQIQIAIDNPQRELRARMFVTARIKVAPRQWDWYTQLMTDHWRDETCVKLTANSLLTPEGPGPFTTADSLLNMTIMQTMLESNRVLAIPESAIVDTGMQRVAYVESGPGMFDGVEVVVGPRCGAYYPVLRGLQLGQRVVTAGAFLVDAESRLNPAASSLYFGSTGVKSGEPVASTKTAPSSESDAAKIRKARNELDSEDRILVDEQEYCPVLEKNHLGSMGKPFKLLMNGQPVYLCCQGCEKEALAHPDETLAKVEALKRKVKSSLHRHTNP
jgi:hypothetical protein